MGALLLIAAYLLLRKGRQRYSVSSLEFLKKGHECVLRCLATLVGLRVSSIFKQIILILFL